MSKLSKLVKNPKKYFQDSWLYKTEIFPEMENYKNLFILSHLGQLHQIEALIDTEQLENCFLVILWTKKNIRMPKLIQDMINKDLISNSMLLLLPNSPNNYNIKSLRIMQNNYKKLINIIKPQTLYMLSFENHYVLLSNYATEKNVTLNLIDEGTATYKTREQSEYRVKTNVYKKILLKMFKLNVIENWHTKYEKIYASFPELLKNTFEANEYIKFSAHCGKFNLNNETKILIKHYGITNNDFLYVNQRYAIKDKDFVDAIITILDKISIYKNAKVFIKMHPKDSDSIKNAFIKKLKNYKNVIFIKENEFLIEPTIQAVNPKGVIGLTSTSLVYASLVSPNTKVYSIKPWFIKLLPTNGNEKGIEIINDHFDILKQFKHVIYIDSTDSLDNKNTKVIYKGDRVDTNIYKKIARKSYEECKYQKTIVNYGWAYPNINSMPINDFDKYLNSIWNTNKIEILDNSFNIWVEYQLKYATITSINEYKALLNSLFYILNQTYEFNTQSISNSIYNNIIILFTLSDKKNSYPMNILILLNTLKGRYQESFTPFIKIKVKELILNFNFQSAYDTLVEINKNTPLDNHDLIDYLKCLINLEKSKEIIEFENNILININNTKIKLICQALIYIYNKDYNIAINILTLNIEEFNNEDLNILKPELILAKAYRLSNDYAKSKVYLLNFEKHSKGNLFAHREIAYLEYQFAYYQKAIGQFEKGYLTTNNIPSYDILKYIDAMMQSEEYKKIIKLVEDLSKEKYSTYICNIHLLCLENIENYEEIIKIEKNFNLNAVQDKNLLESILWVYIRTHRILGNIDISLFYINKYSLEARELNNLIISAEVFELSNNYKKAFNNWQRIIKSYSNTMPIDSWNRYYNIVNLLKR